MNINNTPSGNRIHIGIFGKRNAGKSSIMNAITGQNLVIVSEQKGTTTDPVNKAMELLPLGPVVFIDTPGLDDEGQLGALRVEKTLQVLHKTDIALLIVDYHDAMYDMELHLIQELNKRNIPFLVVINKMEDYFVNNDKTAFQEITHFIEKQLPIEKTKIHYVSARDNLGIYELKEAIAQLVPKQPERKIVGDLIEEGDLVVLVVPIDGAAPKGRLILPQQQTIRDVLDHHGMAIVTQVEQLRITLNQLYKQPKLVITDSQVFKEVADIVPEEILLTSFSVLFARYKGELNTFAEAAHAIDQLKDGDKVLISEGCTHHRQCEDIGTVKIPKLLHKYTGKDLSLTFTSGTEFPQDLSEYQLVIHCGACTLNEKEMQHRIELSKEQKVPMVNYGMAIAYMNGILQRSLECF